VRRCDVCMLAGTTGTIQGSEGLTMWQMTTWPWSTPRKMLGAAVGAGIYVRYRVSAGGTKVHIRGMSLII
jgi:hypothetical protein